MITYTHDEITKLVSDDLKQNLNGGRGGKDDLWVFIYFLMAEKLDPRRLIFEDLRKVAENVAAIHDDPNCGDQLIYSYLSDYLNETLQLTDTHTYYETALLNGDYGVDSFEGWGGFHAVYDITAYDRLNLEPESQDEVLGFKLAVYVRSHWGTDLELFSTVEEFTEYKADREVIYEDEVDE